MVHFCHLAGGAEQVYFKKDSYECAFICKLSTLGRFGKVRIDVCSQIRYSEI